MSNSTTFLILELLKQTLHVQGLKITDYMHNTELQVKLKKNPMIIMKTSNMRSGIYHQKKLWLCTAGGKMAIIPTEHISVKSKELLTTCGLFYNVLWWCMWSSHTVSTSTILTLQKWCNKKLLSALRWQWVKKNKILTISDKAIYLYAPCSNFCFD